jgi:hypothetical protein
MSPRVAVALTIPVVVILTTLGLIDWVLSDERSTASAVLTPSIFVTSPLGILIAVSSLAAIAVAPPPTEAKFLQPYYYERLTLAFALVATIPLWMALIFNAR